VICPSVSNDSQISKITANPVTHAAERRQNGILVQTETFLLAMHISFFFNYRTLLSKAQQATFALGKLQQLAHATGRILTLL